MGLRQIGGRGGIKAGGSVFDGVKPVTGNGFAGCQLNPEQQLRTQPLDRVTVDGVDAWHGSIPTDLGDALLFRHPRNSLVLRIGMRRKRMLGRCWLSAEKAASMNAAFTLPRCTPPRCVTGRKNGSPIFGQ